jgi:hypothetical protein
MEPTIHSKIHKRFKNFVDWIAPEDSTEEAIEEQAQKLFSLITSKAIADNKTVAYSMYSGSFAKKTGLRRHLLGDSEVDGQDIDLGFILEQKDKKGNTLGCQIPDFKKYLDLIYPGSDTGTTKSSATIRFNSNKKLSYDIVPLLKTDKDNIQKLIRTDGKERQSSVQQHIEFVKSRNRKSNDIAGVVHFNQVVRLMKWWKINKQSSSGIFGNGDEDEQVPSIVIDLLCAFAFDQQSVSKTYAWTLSQWFGFLANVVRNRKTVRFTDYYPQVPIDAAALWIVADPVDASNNVVRAWHFTYISELATWCEHARDKMNEAIRKDSEGDDSGSLDALVSIFGNAFKNHCD